MGDAFPLFYVREWPCGNKSHQYLERKGYRRVSRCLNLLFRPRDGLGSPSHGTVVSIQPAPGSSLLTRGSVPSPSMFPSLPAPGVRVGALSIHVSKSISSLPCGLPCDSNILHQSYPIPLASHHSRFCRASALVGGLGSAGWASGTPGDKDHTVRGVQEWVGRAG